MNKINNEYPLVLVFYLDRELMNQKQIMTQYANSVNDVIAKKGNNIIAFFLPTDDKERIECINPITATKREMDKVNKLIDELRKNFDVGQGGDDFKDNDKE